MSRPLDPARPHLPQRPLDLDTVEAFLQVSTFDSFTLAAEAMDPTQAAISLKLERLEERLGCRLIERTPRSVRLSARGEAFLAPARELLAVHDRALAVDALDASGHPWVEVFIGGGLGAVAAGMDEGQAS